METIERLFNLYSNDLLRYIYSLVKDQQQSEDLLQETFYKVYIALDTYQGDNIRPWLFTIAKNTCIDYFRKQRHFTVTADDYFNRIQVDSDIEEDYITNETLQEALKIINKLPKKQKKAFTLKIIKQFTYEECAEIMGMTVPAFKSLIFRVRSSIKQEMGR